MRLLEARYPDYQQVIPPDTAGVSLEVKRLVLLEALRRMVVLTNDKYRGVKIQLKGDNLTILLQNPELGEAREEVEVIYQGEEMEVGFNSAYLMDALRAMRSEEVSFSFTEASRPVKITGPADEKYLSVIMPMQV